MTDLNSTQKTKAQQKQNEFDFELHIDARLLIKRVNTLVAHVSNLDGTEEAEKNSRETSAHIKNIKEIMALNENLKQMQEQEGDYTREEEQALAEELADIIIRNGGLS